MNRIEGQNNGVKDNINMKENRAGNSTMEKVIDDGVGENPYTWADKILSKTGIRTGISVGVAAAVVFGGSAAVAESAIIVEGEMPSQKGSVLDQLENRVANNGVETTADLGIIENEKRPEQIVAENIVGYLNSETPHTDEEIKSKLIVWPEEKIDDLGLINFTEVQGNLLGFLETEDSENLLIFLGTKDKNKERFVTVVRVPLYALIDDSTPLIFHVRQIGVKSDEKSKNKDVITDALSTQISRNIAFLFWEGEVGGAITDKYIDEMNKKYGETTARYLNDQRQNVPYTRSLIHDCYRNETQTKHYSINYKDPRLDIKNIRNDNIGIDDVSNIVNSWRNGDMISVPITLGIRFFNE